MEWLISMNDYSKINAYEYFGGFWTGYTEEDWLVLKYEPFYYIPSRTEYKPHYLVVSSI